MARLDEVVTRLDNMPPAGDSRLDKDVCAVADMLRIFSLTNPPLSLLRTAATKEELEVVREQVEGVEKVQTEQLEREAEMAKQLPILEQHRAIA